MNHDDPIRRAETRIRRIAVYAAAVFCGGLFGLTLVFVAVRFLGSGPLPEISPAIRDAALARWRKASVADYELQVVVRGRDTDTYRVQVRDGTVQAAFRNDLPLKQQRTWNTWTVEGMFQTIDEDLLTVRRQQVGTAERGALQLRLRGEFDRKWGFPRRYQRTELRRFGDNYEVTWEVTEFLPSDKPSRASENTGSPPPTPAASAPP